MGYKKTGRKKGIVLFGIVSVLFAASLVLYNREAIKRAVEFGNGPPPPAYIERRIRSVLELPTYEHMYHTIVYLGEEARFLWIKHLDKRLLFSIDITVQAGVDFRRGMAVHPMPPYGVRIGLPPPEILLVNADESSIREYFAKEFGGRFTRLEFYDEIALSKEQSVQDALERGILEESEARARKAVEYLLSSMGIEKSLIYFETMDRGAD